MTTVTLHAASPQLPNANTLTRWMRLIEQHGGPTAALEALLRDVDKLERLKRAVHSCGIDPEELLAGARPRPR